MRVYIEVVVLDNYLVDYLILCAAGRLCMLPPKKLRRHTAALLGTLYAVLAVIRPFLFLLHPVCKMGCSVLMVGLAFGKTDWRSYLKRLGWFWSLSLAMGGMISGVGYLFGSVSARDGMLALSGMRLWVLLLLAGMGAKASERLLQAWRRRTAAASAHRRLCIEVADKRMETQAMIDSGSGLYEPISGLPVVVVSQEDVKRQLGVEPEKLEPSGVGRLSIPFETVQGSGCMIGFWPTALYITRTDGSKHGCFAAIGLSPMLKPGLALLPAAMAEIG